MPRTKYERGNALTLTLQQAAKELGISEYMAEQLVKKGKLRSVKLGKLVRVPRVALTELLEGNDARATGSG